MGAQIEKEGEDLLLRTDRIDHYHVPEALMREMRSSIFLMGPLLGRMGRAQLYYPGGCAIGMRPINLHLDGLRALGAVIEERDEYIEARGRLRGGEIYLAYPSVGATENLILAAVTARGNTVIRNAAREPEIVDLQNFLNTLGAGVEGAGSPLIDVYKRQPFKQAAALALVSVPALVAITIKEAYRVKRLFSFLDPWADPSGTGYHIIQSLYALSLIHI